MTRFIKNPDIANYFRFYAIENPLYSGRDQTRELSIVYKHCVIKIHGSNVIIYEPTIEVNNLMDSFLNMSRTGA